jgi:ATP/maltotriose-dependent transcriptional regulator MalT
VLGIWGHHEGAADICRETLARSQADPEAVDGLEAELFANTFISTATVAEARSRAQGRLADPHASDAWRVYAALDGTGCGQSADEALALLAPVLADGLAEIPPDSLTAVYAMLVLIWNDELGTTRSICDAVLSNARSRGSASMVAHVSCLRSMIMRRLGQLDEAVADGKLALDFKLATSPPLAVAWAAAPCIDALTCLGRLDEAEALAAVAGGRKPPPGWIHTVLFLQARGALRAAQQRYGEALDDLVEAGQGWRGLDMANPVIASWRAAAAAAHTALDHRAEAARLASEQLALARRADSAATLGAALRSYAATAAAHDAGPSLAEAVNLLETTPARYELALALADLGRHLRQTGPPGEARAPLRRALDLAQRSGAAPLADQARQELLATGARPRRTALTGPDALTSAERRVAGLAAGGMSNRQIAQHLFITTPIVETHLRHAFHKLGVTSRTSLPAQLASPARPGSPPDKPAQAVTAASRP